MTPLFRDTPKAPRWSLLSPGLGTSSCSGGDCHSAQLGREGRPAEDTQVHSQTVTRFTTLDAAPTAHAGHTRLCDVPVLREGGPWPSGTPSVTPTGLTLLPVPGEVWSPCRSSARFQLTPRTQSGPVTVGVWGLLSCRPDPTATSCLMRGHIPGRVLGCEQPMLPRVESDHVRRHKEWTWDTGWWSNNVTPRPGLCSPREVETRRGVSTQSTWGVQGEGNWLKAPKCGNGGAGSANRARGRACGTGPAYTCHVCQPPGALQGQQELPPLGGATWLP